MGSNISQNLVPCGTVVPYYNVTAKTVNLEGKYVYNATLKHFNPQIACLDPHSTFSIEEYDSIIWIYEKYRNQNQPIVSPKGSQYDSIERSSVVETSNSEWGTTAYVHKYIFTKEPRLVDID